MSRTLLLYFMLFGASMAHADGKKFVYRYDAAGNIIGRSIVRQSRRLPDADQQAGEMMEFPTVKTDDAWTDVRIHIPGEVQEGDILLICTPNGLLVRTISITRTEITLDLSSLHRGAYVFTFRTSGKSTDMKINKRR